MQLQRILIAIDLPEASPRLLQQGAYLARHFSAQLEVLHVLSASRYPSDLTEVERARKELEQAVHPILDGLAVTPRLLSGDPAREIIRCANEKDAQLIMLSTHHRGLFEQLLFGNVTGQLLDHVTCPIWTDAAAPSSERPASFAIRRVLCAVDLSPHSHGTLVHAAQIAQEVDAQLTLVHVTMGVRMFAPGGTAEITELKNELVGAAAREVADLQHRCGTNAPVIIDSGDVKEALRRAAERTAGDLLVIGRRPTGGPIGDNGSGLAILRNSPIPVLSV